MCKTPEKNVLLSNLRGTVNYIQNFSTLAEVKSLVHRSMVQLGLSLSHCEPLLILSSHFFIIVSVTNFIKAYLECQFKISKSLQSSCNRKSGLGFGKYAKKSSLVFLLWCPRQMLLANTSHCHDK